MNHYNLKAFFSGFKFWKIGSRKIFAIWEGKHRVSCKKAQISESDSDDDFEVVDKRRRVGVTNYQQILSEQSLFQISKNMKLPFGLRKHLQETFKCHICCSSPIKTPVIFSRCCKQLLGCQLCVDQGLLVAVPCVEVNVHMQTHVR